MSKGDFIAWGTSKFEIENMQEIELEYEDICTPDELGLVLFANPLNFTAAFTLCQGVGGYLASVDSLEDELKVQAVLAKNPSCNSKTFLL